MFSKAFYHRALLNLAASMLVGACNITHDLEHGTDGSTSESGEIGLETTDDEAPGTEVWNGYVEGVSYPSGSDLVRLKITSIDGDVVTGSMTFGMGELPPPATDPDIGYPPVLYETFNPLLPIDLDPILPFEGFEYTFEGELDGNRLKLSGSFAELWTDWCKLQTSYVHPDDGEAAYYDSSRGYKFGPDGCFYKSSGMPDERVDCIKYHLCRSHVCRCDADRCVAGTGASFSLDGTFDGDQFEGTIFGTPSGRMRLMRE